MMIIIQLILYCLLFTGMVRLAVWGGAVNGLYFYPESVQERAIEIGLTTFREAPRIYCDLPKLCQSQFHHTSSLPLKRAAIAVCAENEPGRGINLERFHRNNLEKVYGIAPLFKPYISFIFGRLLSFQIYSE